MGVVLVGLSYRTAPVEVREQLAFAEADLPPALERLRLSGIADERVILSTCNRVELYAATSHEAQAACDSLRAFLESDRHVEVPLDGILYTHGEPESIEHLFRVASGLDSMLLGETEILGQLKKAYQVALQGQHTGRVLNKVFQRAFNVAKQVRTETSIQRGSVSVASAAVEMAERIFTTLRDRVVMVIGAGDTSEKTARALVSRGAKQVLVTNRSLERAQALAEALGGEAIPFDAWAGAFARVDIVISSTAAPSYVLDRARLAPLHRLRKGRPLMLIDIAVPRDIDPEVNLLDDVFLYNIDDLQTIADEAMRQRQEEMAHCEAIIRDKVRSLLAAGAGFFRGGRPSPA